MEEIFRDVVGFEGHYIVSNLGRIISIKFGKRKEIKPFLWSNNRYYYFHASVKGVNTRTSIARCVARAFPEICGEWFEGCTVDHINTVTTDNRAENLRVVSLKENINNPLTIAKMRHYRTEEERKERKRQQSKESYQRCKEYYKSYMKKYYEDNKEKFQKYYREYYQDEERKEKNRQKTLAYYHKHKEEINEKRRTKKEDNVMEIIKKGGLI